MGIKFIGILHRFRTSINGDLRIFEKLKNQSLFAEKKIFNQKNLKKKKGGRKIKIKIEQIKTTHY